MIRNTGPLFPPTSRFAEGRKMVRLSADSLVTKGFLPVSDALPLVVRPAVRHVNLIDWARHNNGQLGADLAKYGAILFRDFEMHTAASFEDFAKVTSCGELLDYRYGSTPRSRISGGIFTSTEYPPDQTIPLHNEMSYARAWPMKIWFCCLEAATVGGGTPIASSVRVYARLSPSIREKFARDGVMYVRNYGSGLDLSIRQVFGTTDRAEIEGFCRGNGIHCEWRSGGTLRTRQTCQAVAKHPKTEQTVWFNQAHLFHISNLDQNVSSQLLAEFGEEDLPRNAYYGDGTPIERSALEHIREAYVHEKVLFSWQPGDILMLDNMLVAHGREPYEGGRSIAVAMAEQYSSLPL